MQSFMVFFRENLPLRQLKLIFVDEGYDNIRLDHSGNSLVIDTEQDSYELATKLEHIIEDTTEERGTVIVRSKLRLEQLLSQNPLQQSDCSKNRIRFLLFQTSPAPDRLDQLYQSLELDPNKIQFGAEGGYVCLSRESDRLQWYVDAIEEELNTKILVRSRDAIDRAIEMVGEHEKRIEKELY